MSYKIIEKQSTEAAVVVEKPFEAFKQFSDGKGWYSAVNTDGIETKINFVNDNFPDGKPRVSVFVSLFKPSSSNMDTPAPTPEQKKKVLAAIDEIRNMISGL